MKKTAAQKNLQFHEFQKKIISMKCFPKTKEITIFELPSIPHFFPQSIRLSLQNYKQPKSHTMFHKNFVLKVHLKGTSIGIVSGETYLFPPNTAFLIFPFQEHYLHQVKDTDTPGHPFQMRILINFSLPAEEQAVLAPLRGRIINLDSEALRILIRLTEKAQSKNYLEQMECPYLINMLLCLFLKQIHQYEVTKSPSCQSPTVQGIFNFIRNKYMQNPTVEEMANQLEISESSLRKQLFLETGKTPGTLIRELRLNQAAELLCFSKLTLREISRKCGFSNPFALSRAFKTQFGMSPRKFRAENAGNY